MIHPRNSPRHARRFRPFVHDQVLLKTGAWGPHPAGICRESEFLDKVRLPGRVPEVIVKSAGTGIRPWMISIDRHQSLGFRSELANVGETILQPEKVVKWKINRVQTCSTIHGDSPVFFDAQLHADALEKRGAQFESRMRKSSLTCPLVALARIVSAASSALALPEDEAPLRLSIACASASVSKAKRALMNAS